jgi:uncharacterized protein YqfA (UPF0365 family)
MLLAQVVSQPVIIMLCIMAVLAIFFLAIFGVLLWTFSPWMRAYMSRTPVSMFDILGMRFRHIDVNAVLKVLIMTRQAGVAVSCRQMESAYLQGVDLEKLTLAMIHAKKQGMELTFEVAA